MRPWRSELGNGAVSRVMVGTDRSQTAVEGGWMGGRVRGGVRSRAAPRPGRDPHEPDRHRVRRRPSATRAAAAAEDLQQRGRADRRRPRPRPRGDRRRPRDGDRRMRPEAAEIDVLVVGNAGMAGRKEFLLGNVPNRISHNARCTVIIVNTTDGVASAVRDPRSLTTIRSSAVETRPQPHLMARGATIATVFAKHGLKELVRSAGRGGRRRQRTPGASGCARRSRSSARRSASSDRSCRPVPTCSRRSSSTSSRSSRTTSRR